MSGKRISKYPLALIENDFVKHRLKFTELRDKYGISIATLAYHSRRKGWLDKRDNYHKQVSAVMLGNSVEKAAKEEFNLINAIDTLIKLKTTLETKVFETEVNKAVTTGKCDNKEIMYLLNKSKDNIGDLTKLSELLKGNATDRVDINQQEKAKRLHRLQEQLASMN